MTSLIVLAKEPRPGRVKTRLTPPLPPESAAALAEAALADTLEAVSRTAVERRVLALDGRPGPWLPPGFDVVAQRPGGLDVRIAGAFEDVGGPALLIGMDTPQVTSGLLEAALRAMERSDAVLGLAADGGWWAMGLRRPDPALVLGVPMSTDGTGAAQLERLRSHDLSVRLLPVLRDVDQIDDAREVAALAPGSRFARKLRSVDEGVGPWTSPVPAG